MNKHNNITVIIFFIIIFSSLIFYHFYKQEKQGERKIQQIKPEIIQPKPIKARVAIVIDDWGYNLNNAHYLEEIKVPLTIAVLPHLPYSSAMSGIARENGKQVILHLPLESKGNKHPEKNTIYCSMSKNEITKKFVWVLRGIPGIVGVNNHQGSKATENARVMGVILPELKQKNLFFLDSRTTDKSVCADIAKKSGVRYAKKDIFLDLPSPALKGEKLRIYIKRQLDKLCEIALKNGYAVGIGHDRKDTLKVLRNTLPFLEENGIKVIFVSELAR